LEMNLFVPDFPAEDAVGRLKIGDGVHNDLTLAHPLHPEYLEVSGAGSYAYQVTVHPENKVLD